MAASSSGLGLRCFCFCIFLPFCMLSAAHALTPATIDNGLQSAPAIECTSSALRIRVQTRTPFWGRLFVKNFAHVPGCLLTGRGKVRQAVLEIPFDSPCRIDRQRSLNPRGLFVTATVVVSFHPIFLTKVDRAYRIRCFYVAGETHVAAALGVTGGTPAHDAPPLPVCRYDLRELGPTGPPVELASVGMPVYHQWTCESSEPGRYCMKVHSCVVDNGVGHTVPILDEEGCAMDPILLDNLDYPTDLTAGQLTRVFKYADRDSLYFQCQVAIYAKENNDSSCVRPDCPTLPLPHAPPTLLLERKRRWRRENVENFQVLDVSTKLLTLEEFANQSNATQMAATKEKTQTATETIRFCFSWPTMALFSLWLLLVALTGAVAVAVRCRRSGSYTVNRT